VLEDAPSPFCKWPNIEKWAFDDKNLELVQPKQFTKADLKERWLIRTRNHNEYMIMNSTRAVGIDYGKWNDKYLDFKNYNNDLTDKHSKEWDIVEVFKPRYESIWKREEEPKHEYTVKELEELTGIKDLKIIK
jgi:hypothetical protein